MALLRNIKDAAGTVFGAGGAALTGTLQNQWKEYFEMDSMASDLLISRGYKRQGDRGVKKDGTRINKGDDHIISNGSVISVADGQCAMIIDGGRLVEICAEPGEFTWDASTAPSMLTGSLGDSIIATGKQIIEAFKFGGEIPKSHRIYYINTKEIINNPFGVVDADFRIVDEKIGLDIDAKFHCSGRYTYRITDPHLFYQFAGNVASEFRKTGEFDRQIKTEVISAFRDALAELSALGIRPNAIKAHVKELRKALNDVLENEYQWYSRCGLELVQVAISQSGVDEQSEADLREAQKEWQKIAALADPNRAGAFLARSQGDAMKLAAGNEATGPMMGFMGMGMAQQAGGMNANAMFEMGAQQRQQEQQAQMQQQMFQMQQQAAAPPAPQGAGWQCSCGATATGNFCAHCGKSPPAPPAGSWNCTNCNTANTANFCPGCGGKKPEAAGGNCKNCGNPVTGPFCPNCGTPQG
jgi:membrane protease subunit (stomatin/prohibitin family)